MSVLTERIGAAAIAGGGLTMGGTAQRVSWLEVHDAANRVAVELAQTVEQDAGVAILSESSPDAVVAIQACLLAGRRVTVLQPPARVESLEDYAGRLRRQVAQIDATLVLVSQQFEPLLAHLSATIKRLDDYVADAQMRPAVRMESVSESCVAVRHMTSGTTSNSRHLDLTHANVLASCDGTMTASDHDAIHKVLVSWLPLSHDMGLFGFLIIPMVCGRCELVLSDPSRFLANPGTWMRDINDYGGTGTAGPNFAYKLAARIMAARPSGDLSSLIFALCGGEKISRDAVDSFNAAGKHSGLNAGALIGAYGLAEATLAVSIGEVGTGVRFTTVGSEGMQRETAALGPPIPGIDLMFQAPTGNDAVREVLVRGPAVSTDVVTPDGWLHTGDDGRLVHGNVHIVGRLKEIIIRGGVNYYPDDLERTLWFVPGVKLGAAAVMGLPGKGGTEEIVAFVETSVEGADADALAERVASALKRAHGLAVGVKLLPQRTIPKTSSGKVQRLLLRTMFGE